MNNIYLVQRTNGNVIVSIMRNKSDPGMLHGMPGRSGRGNQKITKQRIKLESRYLPALFSAKFLKHVPQLFH